MADKDQPLVIETNVGPALQEALDAMPEGEPVDTTVFEEPAEGGDPYPPGIGPDPTVSPGTVKTIGAAAGELPLDQQAALKSRQVRAQQQQDAQAKSAKAAPSRKEGDK